MMYSFPSSFIFEKKGHIAYMTLNRPEALNSVTLDMLDAFDEASRIINEDPDIYVAVITGTGDRAFCTGGDLKEAIPKNTSNGIEMGDPTKRIFSDVTKPIISAINGHCLAGGAEIMLATDIRIASENATFGVPEVRWSLIPIGGACVNLARQIPWARAMELLLIGDRISAQEAFQMNLINRVVKQEDLMNTVEDIALRICENGPYAVRKVKEVVRRAYNMAWDEAYFTEYSVGKDVFSSEDAKEGPKAFAEKRKPIYQNR
ncbi:enoyl-CoA hydratase-related protein [Neobacillus niacini]|uniref:enoyl-CoA hydratase/isomerase family protein n=1 Tax=Neobacillus niacini TaxID=86668 RepID=UPI002FFF6486